MKPAAVARLAVVAIATGCSTTYQSARVLDPGQVQLTAAISRTAPNDDPASEEVFWTGDIQARRGLHDKIDGGLRYAGGAGSHFLQVDLKLQLGSRLASIMVPMGLIFSDEGRDFEYGGVVLTPTFLFGAELTPNRVELVGAPKLVVILPDDGGSEIEVGASLGLRLSNDLRRWAIQPELAYLALTDEETDLVTFGIALSANY